MKNRVLVIDDDDDFVRLLRHRCESIGAHAFDRQSLPQAIELIESGEVDLLCIDLDMHGGSGWQVANYLGTNGRALMTPAIVLTESGDVSSMKASSRIRAYYVQKLPTFWYRLKPIMQEFLELPTIQQPSGETSDER